MPTGNMSSEPRGCTASNHRLKAIQCCCSVKLMLFFFQVFCCQWHSRKVFQEGFCTVILQAMRATKSRPCAAILQALCHHCCRPCAAFLHVSSRKTAFPELQECMPCAAVPVPLNCRTSAASLQILCGSSIVLVCYTAGPVLLHCRPCAVTALACCCHNAGPMNLKAVTRDILDC